MRRARLVFTALAAAASFGGAAAPSQAASNLLANPSFEAGTFPNPSGGWWQQVGYNGNAKTLIPGWNESGDGVDWHGYLPGPYNPTNPYAQDGDRSVDLVGEAGFGTITQAVPTTIGAKYVLSFFYAAHVGCVRDATATAIASAGGTELPISSTGTNTYKHAFVPFTAAGASTPISFRSTNKGTFCNGGVTIDNVSVTSAAGVGKALITEFRPTGLSEHDQYVQLYNRSLTEPLDVGGWVVEGSGGSTTTIPSNTILQPGAHLLLAGSELSFDHAAAAIPLPAFPENGGVRLLDADGAMVDAVGLSGAPSGYYENAPLAGSDPAGQQAYVRRYVEGVPVDSDANIDDFVSVGTAAAGVSGSVLGAPRPDHVDDPTAKNDFLQSSLVAQGQPSTASPNRVVTPADGPNRATLTLNRTITNCSGLASSGVCLNARHQAPKSVTRLRFRITDLTTVGSPGTGAELIATSSVDASYGALEVKGLPVDSPTASNGGGLNSTLTATALIPSGLAPGASLNVAFTFEVGRTGAYRFGFNTEDDLAGSADPLWPVATPKPLDATPIAGPAVPGPVAAPAGFPAPDGASGVLTAEQVGLRVPATQEAKSTTKKTTKPIVRKSTCVKAKTATKKKAKGKKTKVKACATKKPKTTKKAKKAPAKAASAK